MEQNNIIFLVILLLIILYCSERLIHIVRENFTESLPEMKNKCQKKYTINTIDHDTLSIKKTDYLKKIVDQLVVELNNQQSRNQRENRRNII